MKGVFILFENPGKRVVCTLLVFGLAFSSLLTVDSQAAKKTKLKTKKITMKVGQKKKIVINGKKKKAVYRFVSSSKAKATVSKSGVISAKKAGKVTVTVKETYKKKTKKLGKTVVTIKKKDDGKKPQLTAVPSSSPVATPVVTPVPQTSSQPQSTEGPKQTEEPKQTEAPVVTESPAPVMKPIGPYIEDTDSSVPDGFDKVNNEVAGTVEDITYESTVIKKDAVVKRKAKVVLPKGYTEDKKYPVVYMNHGIGGNETVFYGDKVQNLIWNAIANGDAEEMIAVFPSCCANETNNQGDNDFFSVEHYAAYNNFLNDLKECLMPYINENYSTLTGRENTAVCGFSMGGRVSLHIGFTLQDTFRYVGAFCPAPGIFEHNDNGVHEDGLFTHETFTLQDQYMDDTLVMIVKGKDDGVVKNFPKDYTDALTANQVPHLFFELPGGHDTSVYKPGMYNFLRRIFHRNEE